MEENTNSENLTGADSTEDFNLGLAIAVLMLLLTFIGSSVYILIRGYLEVV